MPAGSDVTVYAEFLSAAATYIKRAWDGKKVETASGGGYHVARIRGIPAKELQNSFTLDLTAGTAGGSVTYSPMNYCYKVLTGGTESESLINAVKALYLYSQAAKRYFA